MEKEYVFISYSTNNQQNADAIRQYFGERNIATWMAPSDIPPGSTYGAVINQALENCSCLLLLLSEDSQNSPWVQKEVERAISYGKTIIPVQIEEVVLNDSFKFFIGDTQIIALPSLKLDSYELQKITNTVEGILKIQPTQAVPSPHIKPSVNTYSRIAFPSDAKSLLGKLPPKRKSFISALILTFLSLIVCFIFTGLSLTIAEDLTLYTNLLIGFIGLTLYRKYPLVGKSLATASFISQIFLSNAVDDKYILSILLCYLLLNFTVTKVLFPKRSMIDGLCFFFGMSTLYLIVNDYYHMHIPGFLAVIFAFISAARIRFAKKGELKLSLAGLLSGAFGALGELIGGSSEYSSAIVFVIMAALVLAFLSLAAPQSINKAFKRLTSNKDEGETEKNSENKVDDIDEEKAVKS